VVPVKPVRLTEIFTPISKNTASPSMVHLLNMFSLGAINAKSLITHHYPLTQIKEAVETFVQRKDGAIKVIVHP
jgi:threonine dehydrogenase-like Zn-dependent dehydrogenase